MRLARLALLVLAGLSGLASVRLAGVHAQASAPTPPPVTGSARVEVYQDTDATTVVRPRASVEVPLGARDRLRTTYTADVVSSASVDVVSRASEAIRETRHEGVLNLTHDHGGEVRTEVGVSVGVEPDYLSQGLRASHERPLDARRQHHLGLALTAGLGRVGSVLDPDFRRHLGTYALSGTFTRVTSARSLVRLALEASGHHGFQSSAYRTVRLGDYQASRGDPDDPESTAWVFVGVTGTVRERHPSHRLRGRLVGTYLQALGRRGALSTQLGGYADSFGVRAGDLALEARVAFGTRALLRAGARGYVQSRASFYRARYVGAVSASDFVSDDKELGRMRTASAHVASTLTLGPVRLDARVEVVHSVYPMFTLLPEKTAVVASLSIGTLR